MITEAAWFGKPVYMLKLDGKSDKFDRLHASVVDRGVARWYSGEVDIWTPEPLREIDRVADEVVRLLLAKHPQRKETTATASLSPSSQHSH